MRGWEVVRNVLYINYNCMTFSKHNHNYSIYSCIIVYLLFICLFNYTLYNLSLHSSVSS